MNFIFATLTAIFDLLFAPFRNASPWWPLLLFSLLFAVAMLLAFRFASNQPAIRRAKQRIGAHLLEVRLFQDQLGVVLRAYGRLLAATGIYLLHSLKPLAVILIPMVLLIAQMELRLGREAAQPNAPVVLKAFFAPDVALESVELSVPAGVQITAPALRIPESNEVNWRIEAKGTDVSELRVSGGGVTEPKHLTAQRGLATVSPLRSASALDLWLYPGEPQLAAGAIRKIEVGYASRNLSLFGWQTHWLIPFFLFSIVFGYALKGVMGAEF